MKVQFSILKRKILIETEMEYPYLRQSKNFMPCASCGSLTLILKFFNKEKHIPLGLGFICNNCKTYLYYDGFELIDLGKDIEIKSPNWDYYIKNSHQIHCMGHQINQCVYCMSYPVAYYLYGLSFDDCIPGLFYLVLMCSRCGHLSRFMLNGV